MTLRISNDDLKRYKEISPTSLTVEESNGLIDRLSFLSNQFSEKINIKIKKQDNFLSVSIYCPIESISLKNSLDNLISKGDDSLVFHNSFYRFLSKIEEEIIRHDRVDISGNKRIDSVCEIGLPNSLLSEVDKISQLILLMSKKRKLFTLEESLEYTEMIDIDEDLIKALYNSEFTNES